jgi:hypothetical protein
MITKRPNPPGVVKPVKGLKYEVMDLFISSPEATQTYPNLVHYAVYGDEPLRKLCEGEAKFSTATVEAIEDAIEKDIHHHRVRYRLLEELGGFREVKM